MRMDNQKGKMRRRELEEGIETGGGQGVGEQMGSTIGTVYSCTLMDM